MIKKMQYATIPIELLEIESRKKKMKSSYIFQLFKITPYKALRLSNIVIKVGDETTPYVEELLTKNKIGLNKEGGYKVYIPGDIIYTICTKEQAYLIAAEQLNYHKKIENIFTQSS